MTSKVRDQTSRTLTVAPSGTGVLRRTCACEAAEGEGVCDECKKGQHAQRRATGRWGGAGVPPIVDEVLSAPGRPLDAQTRGFMEMRFGHDFSQVRVHADSRAAESARAVNALAYTVGRHVVFGAGSYAPHGMAGATLLAHELAHVVQQETRDAPTGEMEIGAADDPLEHEADHVAETVMQGGFDSNDVTRPALKRRVLRRALIYSGHILDEGTCAGLACKSKYACEDENGIACPTGTRNAHATKKYRPLFSCDIECSRGLTCSDSDTWMAIPFARFNFSKCGQDLVICANGRFTHAQVRDRSEVKTSEQWEVSHGIQDALGVSPYATFGGAIYSDENSQAFSKDRRCNPPPAPAPDAGASRADAPADGGAAASPLGSAAAPPEAAPEE